MLRILILLILLNYNTKPDDEQNVPRYKYHHTEDGFRNENLAIKQPGFSAMFPFIFRKLWNNLTTTKYELPRDTVNYESLHREQDFPKITWVGHSTLLVQIDGRYFLTDPVWNSSIGPGSPFDPGRMNEPGIDIEKLPQIDFVLISHDHYDHLDQQTIEKLSENKSIQFIVPLKVKEILEGWGIRNKIIELDWWDSTEVKGLQIVCTPAQHFSGRSLSRNTTLWASFVVKGKTKKFYFAGDTGYWKHFKEIGDEFGPIDLAAIPIGAYVPKEIMKYMHLDPVNAVEAFIDLKANNLVPIHYGTFPLSDEPVEEPPRLLKETVGNKNLNEESFWLLRLGETRTW
jgi:N-acyl-phosphatidylethanolamine-hydrolysing phospholipase D